jgi:hypothetical protein
MRWVGDIEHMGEKRKACKVLVRNLKERDNTDKTIMSK